MRSRVAAYETRARATTGLIMVKRLNPEAFIAVISLSELMRVKATRTAMRKEMGIVYMRKAGVTDKTNRKMKEAPTPWTRRSSTNFMTLLRSAVTVRTARLMAKGTAISPKM